jgi:hypothetical protein
MSFPSSTWLTPIKHTCLQVMAQGPLDRTETGWISRKGVEGCFNTHTVTWLAGRGFVSISSSKRSCSITAKGLGKIGMRAEDFAA